MAENYTLEQALEQANLTKISQMNDVLEKLSAVKTAIEEMGQTKVGDSFLWYGGTPYVLNQVKDMIDHSIRLINET